MINLLIASAVGLALTLVLTPLFIKLMTSRGIGQQVRDDGPQQHLTKQGTPTMGGVVIVLAGAAAYAASHISGVWTVRGVVGMLVIIGCGLVGFADDWISNTHRRSLGLSSRAKALALLVVAIPFAVICVEVFKVNTLVSLTGLPSGGVNVGKVAWAILAVLVILAATNAVNLTDGLDGLAAGSTTFNFVAFTIIGFVAARHLHMYHNPNGLDEACLAAAMGGATAGFLWWNGAPAKVFMGDTGSLAIGGALAVLAILENCEFLLLIIGIVYVMETMSVMIQVTSYKLTHKRVFKMAPIHHHFELMGWPEITVIIRFWMISAGFTAIGLGVFYAAFLAHGGNTR